MFIKQQDTDGMTASMMRIQITFKCYHRYNSSHTLVGNKNLIGNYILDRYGKLEWVQ